MKHRRTIVAAAVLILAATGVYVFQRPAWEVRKLDARYERVARGMTRDEVVSIMGRPGVKFEGPYTAWWGDSLLGEDQRLVIVDALRYHVPRRFLSVSFEFTFDGQGRVVGKHRYD